MPPKRNTRSSKKDRAPSPDPVDEQEVSDDAEMRHDPFNRPNNILPYDDRPREEEPAGTGQGEKEKEISGDEGKGDKGSKVSFLLKSSQRRGLLAASRYRIAD